MSYSLCAKRDIKPVNSLAHLDLSIILAPLIMSILLEENRDESNRYSHSTQ